MIYLWYNLTNTLTMFNCASRYFHPWFQLVVTSLIPVTVCWYFPTRHFTPPLLKKFHFIKALKARNNTGNRKSISSSFKLMRRLETILKYGKLLWTSVTRRIRACSLCQQCLKIECKFFLRLIVPAIKFAGNGTELTLCVIFVPNMFNESHLCVLLFLCCVILHKENFTKSLNVNNCDGG